ncbi:MAG: hypothetical protein ABI426_06125 [Flavobacterium sp.]
MKKMALALALVLGFSTLTFAQEKKQAVKENTEKLTIEQRNQLRLKKMTLDLDLNASQQKEVAAVIADQSSKREAKMAEMKEKKATQKKPTADEKFAMENKRLDNQIEMKAKMKKILNDKQMEKWENSHQKRRNHMHKAEGKHKVDGNNQVTE